MLVAGMAISVCHADEVAIPPLQHRVTDLTNTLTAEQQAGLEARLATFEQQKGSQIAVLIIPTTQPEDIAQYSIRVFDAWKLGRKGVSDGVLILLAKQDHKVRIEVGRGLEGAIPDIAAKRIISEIMAPHFKAQDFYGGIAAATDRLISLTEGEALPPAPAKHQANRGSSWEDLLPMVLFASLILGGVLRAIFGRFLGGFANAGLIGLLVWILGGGLIAAIVLAIIGLVLTMLTGRGGGFIPSYGGFDSGGYSGESYSGGNDSFSGGGGDSAGGGASGDW